MMDDDKWTEALHGICSVHAQDILIRTSGMVKYKGFKKLNKGFYCGANWQVYPRPPSNSA